MTEISRSKVSAALRAFLNLSPDERESFHAVLAVGTEAGLIPPAIPRKRGRPAGSKNQPKETNPAADMFTQDGGHGE